MNFFAIFYTVWSITSSVYAVKENGQSSFDPLPILYYPTEERYVMSELRVLDKMISNTMSERPSFTFVLLYCGEIYYIGQNSTLIPQALFETVEEALSANITCELPYQPRIFHNVGGYDYAIGYWNAASLTDPHELPESSYRWKMLDAHLYVIWYEMDKIQEYTVQTIHYFYAYDRSLLPSSKCEDYTLAIKNAEQTIVEQTIKNCYDPENQDYVFHHNEILPEARILPESRASNEFFQTKQYFVPHPMVPINDFVEDSMRMATCTTIFTTIPIWQSISKGPLTKVETFIQRVAEKVDVGTLQVRTRTHSMIRLPTKHEKINRYIHLKHDYRLIPVPKYLIKIVAHRPAVPYEREEYHKKGIMSRSYVIIVVQNELHLSSLRFCNNAKQQTCKENGWDVADDDDEKGRVYCCTLDDEEFRDENIFEIDFRLGSGTFDLNHVLVRDSNWVDQKQFKNIAETLAPKST